MARSPYQDTASSAEMVRFLESPVESPQTPTAMPGTGSKDEELNTPPSSQYRTTGYYIDRIPVDLQLKIKETVSDLDLEDNHKGPMEQNSSSHYGHESSDERLAQRQREIQSQRVARPTMQNQLMPRQQQ